VTKVGVLEFQIKVVASNLRSPLLLPHFQEDNRLLLDPLLHHSSLLHQLSNQLLLLHVLLPFVRRKKILLEF